MESRNTGRRTEEFIRKIERSYDKRIYKETRKLGKEFIRKAGIQEEGERNL